jgi:hypothetical protein
MRLTFLKACGEVIRRAAGTRAGRARAVALAAGGAAVFAAGVTATGVALAGAAGPALPGTIGACVNNTTRAVTVPAAGQSCPAGTSVLQLQAPALPGLGIVDSGARFHFDDPEALAFDGTHIWAANFFGNSVTEINASDGSLVRNLSGPSYNFQGPVALLFDGSHIWVSNAGNSVTEINASDGSLVRNLSDPSYGFNAPHGIAFDGTHIWVANALGDSVTEINASDGSLVQNISDTSYKFNIPFAVAFDGIHVWVTNLNGNSVTEMTTGGTLVRVLSGAPYNFSTPDALIATSPNPIRPVGFLWVLNKGNNTVTELNTGVLSDGSFVQLLGAFGGTGAYNFSGPAGVTATRNRIWVANINGDSVTEFNTADGSWVRTITGPSYGLERPDAVAFTPTGVWVANDIPGANTLTELPLG